MGLTAVTVEVPGGEVGDLVAEHLEKDGRGGHREFRGQAHDAALEMDPSQGSAEPSAPLDSDALREASDPPAILAVS